MVIQGRPVTAPLLALDRIGSCEVPISNKGMLEIISALHERYAELTIQEIKKAVGNFDSLHPFMQFYTVALWMKRANALMKIQRYIPEKVDIDDQFKLIAEVFPNVDRSGALIGESAASRLEWFKKRVAQDFEKSVLGAISANHITSPVEQFFLMEWEYLGLGKRYNIKLIPQRAIGTDSGQYYVDFAITPKNLWRARATIAIEIDGHEFHEKTQEQVRNDKARERALQRAGVTVLRFSGSEVVRSSRRCLEEVAKFLDSLEASSRK
jgi:very-short-patch-repair endonuclease